jgi:hypothetical protein
VYLSGRYQSLFVERPNLDRNVEINFPDSGSLSAPGEPSLNLSSDHLPLLNLGNALRPW